MDNELTTKICSSITDTVSKIDVELKKIDNKGIFFAPELYIAFECGKRIISNRQNIWGQKNYIWKRETKIENYGIADLFFSTDNGGKGLIVEFKILQTINAYISDIEKLKKMNYPAAEQRGISALSKRGLIESPCGVLCTPFQHLVP
jgi:hypothetical protein